MAAASTTITLTVEPRTLRKKGGSRKLRKQGLVPAIVYGAGESPKPVQVNRKEIEKILRELHGEVVVFDIQIANEHRRGIIKDVQYHPVTGDILHVDFQIIHTGEEIEVTVPVVVMGEAPGVKAGGIMEVLLHEIDLRAPVDRIPPHIEVDVQRMDLGDVIHVRDLAVPEGVTLLEDPDEPVVVIRAPHTEAGGEVPETPSEGGEETTT